MGQNFAYTFFYSSLMYGIVKLKGGLVFDLNDRVVVSVCGGGKFGPFARCLVTSNSDMCEHYIDASAGHPRMDNTSKHPQQVQKCNL